MGGKLTGRQNKVKIKRFLLNFTLFCLPVNFPPIKDSTMAAAKWGNPNVWFPHPDVPQVEEEEEEVEEVEEEDEWEEAADEVADG